MRKLDCSVAESYMPRDAKIAVVVRQGPRIYNVDYKHYTNLTQKECVLLTPPDGSKDLATVAEQTKRIREKEAAQTASRLKDKPADLPFFVRDHKIVLKRDKVYVLEKKDIQPLADRMIAALKADRENSKR